MSLRSQDWPAIKYHGLRNQGSTCYLNSVLQVLYMTKDFREAVKSHCHETPKTPVIDVELNKLFDGLKTCVGQTRDITRRLGIKHVHQQQDAADYYEKILRMTSPEASQIFHGNVTHRTTCSGCLTSTDADAFFWSIHLAMPDPYTLYDVRDGFDMFFRPVSINGDNQMYCDTCDSKENATIACELKDQPEVLVLLLKRFDFDYQYMTHVKINSCVDIPDTLHTPQKQIYELYAIVDHYGDLRGGHYSSRIKSLDDNDHGRWYWFDDDRVKEVNRQQLQEEIQRSQSAYLLFYRKQQMPSPHTSAPETNRPAEEQQRPISGHAEMANEKLRKRKSQGADVDNVGDAKQIKTETPNEMQRAEEGDIFKTGPVENHQHTGRFQSLRSKSGEAKQDIEERAHTLLTGHGEVREDTDRGGGVDGDGIVRQATERSHAFIPEEGEKRIVQGDIQITTGKSRVGAEQSRPSTPSKVPLAKTEGSRAETEIDGRKETPKDKKEKQRKTQSDKEKTFGYSTVGGESCRTEISSQVGVVKTREGSRTETEKDGQEEMQKYNFKVEDESKQRDQCEPQSGHDEKHVTDICSAKADVERRVRQNRFPAQQVSRWEEPNKSEFTVDETMETSVDDCTGLRNKESQRGQVSSQQYNIATRMEICDVELNKNGPGTSGQGYKNSGYNIGKTNHVENDLETLDSNAHTAKQDGKKKPRKTHGGKEKTFGDSTMVVEQSTPETPSKVPLAKTEESRTEREKHGRGETPKHKFEVEDESKQTDRCKPQSGYDEIHATENGGDKADAERSVPQNKLSAQQVDKREEPNKSQFTVDESMETEHRESQDDGTGIRTQQAQKGRVSTQQYNYKRTERCDVDVNRYGPETSSQGFKKKGNKLEKKHYHEEDLETLESNAQTAKQDSKKDKQRKTQGDKETTFGGSTIVVEQSAPETPSKVALLSKTEGSRSETEKDGREQTPKDKKEKQRKTQGDKEKTCGYSTVGGEQCRTDRSSQVGVVKTREGSRTERQIPAHQVDGQEESNTPFLNRQRSPIEITECEDNAPTGLTILDGSLTPSRGSVTSKRKNKCGWCFPLRNLFKRRSMKKIGIYSGKKTKSK